MPEEIKSDKLVIYDANIPELCNNYLFVPELAGKISHTILPACHLYNKAAARGIRLILPMSI